MTTDDVNGFITGAIERIDGLRKLDLIPYNICDTSLRKEFPLRTRTLLLISPILFLILLGINIVFVGSRPPMKVNQLVESSIGDASFLNPILAQDSASSEINGFVFNGLIKYDQNLQNFVGELAESWTIKAGPEPEITFFLRKGVFLHDGKEFTAEDVKFTYDKIMDERQTRSDGATMNWSRRRRSLIPTLQVTYSQPFSPGSRDLEHGDHPQASPREPRYQHDRL